MSRSPLVRRPAPAVALLPTLALLAVGCHYDNDKAADPEAEAVLAVKAYVGDELSGLAAASVDLCGELPTADDDGWTYAADSLAVDAARAEWRRARAAYEHVEGAIAVLYPDLDFATDARYEDALAERGEADLFDAEGFTGVHAVERILWADDHPAEVVAFESALPGYQPAAFPADADEATRLHDALCGRLVDDTATMEADFEPLALDSAAAFRGVIGSMEEQLEKVNLAATGEDESRYARFTLADMRANLEGGRAIYGAFQPWLAEAAPEVDTDVVAGFDRIEAAYADIEGDAVPAVPEGWNPDAPTEAQLQTPYGQLWSLLLVETDVAEPGSLVERMSAAADALGIPVLP